MANERLLENDSRWHHIKNYVAPEDRRQLAKEIREASKPSELVGILYLTMVTAYKDGHLEGNLTGRQAA